MSTIQKMAKLSELLRSEPTSPEGGHEEFAIEFSTLTTDEIDALSPEEFEALMSQCYVDEYDQLEDLRDFESFRDSPGYVHPHD